MSEAILSKIKLTSDVALPQQIAENLEAQIRDGEMKPGHKLPSEAELCKLYDVSRTVIREAVSRLKHDGLLESRQGSGITVASWENRRVFRVDWIDKSDPYSYNFFYEIRVMIGVESAALAAIRHQEQDLVILNRLMDEMAEAIKKGEAGSVPHRIFHKSIAAASYNPLLIEFESFLHDRLWDVFKRARRRTQTTPGLAPKVHQEHQMMLDGIASRSPELARQAALNHLRNASRRAGLNINQPLD